jgi:hypothetical protein
MRSAVLNTALNDESAQASKALSCIAFEKSTGFAGVSPVAEEALVEEDTTVIDDASPAPGFGVRKQISISQTLISLIQTHANSTQMQGQYSPIGTDKTRSPVFMAILPPSLAFKVIKCIPNVVLYSNFTRGCTYTPRSAANSVKPTRSIESTKGEKYGNFGSGKTITSVCFMF